MVGSFKKIEGPTLMLKKCLEIGNETKQRKERAKGERERGKN